MVCQLLSPDLFSPFKCRTFAVSFGWLTLTVIIARLGLTAVAIIMLFLRTVVLRMDGRRRLSEHPCKGYNRHSIGVCYIGGLAADCRTPEDTRTDEQRKALKTLIEQLHRKYPKALIVGHHDLNPMKACPCFDVVGEFRTLQPR